MSLTRDDVAYAFDARFRPAFAALVRENARDAFRQAAPLDLDFSLFVDAIIKSDLFERGIDPDVASYNAIERMIARFHLRLRQSDRTLLQGEFNVHFRELDLSGRIRLMLEYAMGDEDYTIRWVETDGSETLFQQLRQRLESCGLLFAE
jgi:hypothetical protein